MATQKFDVALIGAGPTAIAALQALGGKKSIAVVSGASSVTVPRAALHPKIQAVSVSNNESPGVVTAYQRPHDLRRPLFSSSVAGGFANYWGQQFLRYEPGDPWPREIFEDFQSYEDDCKNVESSFVLTGGADVQVSFSVQPSYLARIPRLLIGSLEHPMSDLMAMRFAFHTQIEKTKAYVFETRAESLIHANGDWHVILQNGQTIIARNILLAAGVVGTSELLTNSFADIETTRFADHAPWMLYSIGLRKLFAQRPSSALHHFNAMTLEKMKGNACAVFASLYDMGRVDLNLLLASTIGRTSKMLRKWHAPAGASFLKPVQIWTAKTFDEIEIDPRTATAKSVSEIDSNTEDDQDLMDTLAVLRSLEAHCLKVTRTSPGYGFHYHNLRIKPSGGALVSVTEFLRERSFGRIACVDASILPKIGLRPHTLTAMAASHHIARDLC